MKAFKTIIRVIVVVLLLLLIIFSAVRIAAALTEDEPTDEPGSATDDPTAPSEDETPVEAITLDDDSAIYFYAGD